MHYVLQHHFLTHQQFRSERSLSSGCLDCFCDTMKLTLISSGVSIRSLYSHSSTTPCIYGIPSILPHPFDLRPMQLPSALMPLSEQHVLLFCKPGSNLSHVDAMSSLTRTSHPEFVRSPRLACSSVLHHACTFPPRYSVKPLIISANLAASTSIRLPIGLIPSS